MAPVTDARTGAPIDRKQAAFTLPAERTGAQVQPVAYAAGTVVLSVTPESAAGAPQQFELWDPASGRISVAWAGEAGTQDIVTSASGDWVATVRTGFELPFATWTLNVWNVRTGEARTLATGDATIAADPALHPDLPMGFAPYPSISGDQAVWEQLQKNGAGVTKTIRLANLATGEQRTIAAVPNAHSEDLRLPVIAGNRVAWVHRTFGTHTQATIEWTDLQTGRRETIEDAGNPWSVALAKGGKVLAWDDALQAKFAVDLDSGQRVRYAGAVGWGTTSDGQRITWSPAGAQGGAAGYYDIATGTARFVTPAPGARVNVASLLGQWFAWQELDAATGQATYYFAATEAAAP